MTCNKSSHILIFAISIIAIAPLLSRFQTVETQLAFYGAIIFIFALLIDPAEKYKPHSAIMIAVATGAILTTAARYTHTTGQIAGDISKILVALIIFSALKKMDSRKVRYAAGMASVIFCAGTMLASLSQKFYGLNEEGDYRFSGLMGNVNLNSYVFCLALIKIFLWGEKSSHLKRSFVLIAGFSFISIASETKSLVLLAPLVACLVLRINIKITNLFLGITLALGVALIINLLPAIAALSQLNPSFATRWYITEMLLEIAVNSKLIPLGIGYTRSFLETNYYINSAHNDFLQYTIDYGLFFVAFLVLAWQALKPKDIQTLCLFLFYCSAALHNNLFSVYLVPLFLLINHIFQQRARS